MGVRVESLRSELDSKTCFAYEEDADKWIMDPSINSLSLQDPSYAKIKGESVILGVKAWEEDNSIGWRQDIYRGNSIRDLDYFTSGPIGMKDIRLVDLEDRIGVFTRPQGKIGGKGKIGYLEIGKIDELENLTESDWYSAKIVENLFNDNHWGGVNQAIKLPNGEIGIIGHIAYQTINERNQLEKHYRAIAFRFNPETNEHSGFKIIAKRSDFPSSPSKRGSELEDVIFSAGIDEANNFYAGVSDFCIGRENIEYPF